MASAVHKQLSEGNLSLTVQKARVRLTKMKNVDPNMGFFMPNWPQKVLEHRHPGPGTGP